MSDQIGRTACAWCGVKFIMRQPGQTCCSPKHRRLQRQREHAAEGQPVAAICIRKRAYPSRDAALAALRRVNRENVAWNDGRAVLTATYECPACGWWHLTSKPQREVAG